ncbi:MAG: hypothetical protein O2916_11740 [Proteobacteria bacterium]|nr:hypothetical protein [Pseudomonadota bacterium]
MTLTKICTNKFFLMALTASFAFTLTMFNITDNSIQDVKADFLTDVHKIDIKLNSNNEKIESVLINQARIEQKLDNLRP